MSGITFNCKTCGKSFTVMCGGYAEHCDTCWTKTLDARQELLKQKAPAKEP